jgi:glycosyltransferase involved in cell wall biosynthesis
MRRVVMSAHGYLANATGRLSRLQTSGAALWTRLAGATVCVSEDLRRDLIERWHADADRLVRIYNPIVVQGVDPTLDAAGLAAREPIVLAAGRLVEVKDHVFLVRAFARMRDRSARLVILGQGHLREAIEAEAHAHGVADRVVLPGYVDRPWIWYARARCLALTSRVEAFGNVVVEALAHGLPVVSTPCGGPTEILDDPSLGEIVPFDDVDAWARALDAAVASPGDPAPRMRRAADFDAAHIALEYEALIERLIADRSRRRGAAQPSSAARSASSCSAESSSQVSSVSASDFSASERAFISRVPLAESRVKRSGSASS